eukprot:gene1957-2399_t
MNQMNLHYWILLKVRLKIALSTLLNCPMVVGFSTLLTPGFNDTRGIKQDDININKILKKIESLGQISAIIVVINGSNARLTVNLKNVMVKIKGNLPDSIVNSLCFVLTNCWDHDKTFDLETISEFLKPDESNVFFMNNAMFSNDPSIIKPSGWKHLEFDWNQCFEVLYSMVEYIKSIDSVASKDFKIMRQSRSEIQALLHGTRLEINNFLKVHDEIIIAKAQLKGYEDDEGKFKNYTQKKTVDKVTLVDAKYHSTICSTCNYVCHDHCGLHETSQVGNAVFKGCAAMTGAGHTCGKCPKKCSFQVHYHARKTMQKTQETLDEVLQDIKDKYDAAVKGIKTSKLKMESASLTNLAVRNQSDDFIRSLSTLVDNLTN